MATAEEEFAQAFASIAAEEDVAAGHRAPVPPSDAPALKDAPAAKEGEAAPAPKQEDETAPAAGTAPAPKQEGESAPAAGIAPAPKQEGESAPAAGIAPAPKQEGETAPAAGTAPTREETPPKQKTVDDILAEAGIVPYVMPDEHKQRLDTFRKTYGEDLAPAIDALAEQVRREVTFEHQKAMYSALLNLNNYLAPFLERLAALDSTNAAAELVRRHPDYEKIRVQLPAWIETQPKIYRETLKKVYDEGTVDEVDELVSSYKRSVNPAPPQQQPGESSGPGSTPPKPELNPRADRLSPVPSKRTVPAPKSSGVDQTDFKGGWGEAAALERTGS